MTVGVLGGGQLGRMLALAGVPLGERFLFLDPSREACAGHVGELLTGPYEETEMLSELARRSRVVTFEFENVGLAAARYLAELVPVYPPPRALEVSQDRLEEKRFFAELGIPTPKFAAVSDEASLYAAGETLGYPFVLKTRRFGYDGKGQLVVHEPHAISAAWLALGKAPLIAEERIDFSREVSAIGVRSKSGEVVCYCLFENVHEGGVLRFSIARFDDPMQQRAEQWLRVAMLELDYVGAFTIEFFERNGELLANEMAPRVHNSGHLTIEGCETSQFENHIRAILGEPLGRGAPRCHAAMVNLLGDTAQATELLSQPGVHLHRYGKPALDGRKCGHLTILADSGLELRERVQVVLARINPTLGARLTSTLAFG